MPVHDIVKPEKISWAPGSMPSGAQLA